jgi:hypothetical protein
MVQEGHEGLKAGASHGERRAFRAFDTPTSCQSRKEYADIVVDQLYRGFSKLLSKSEQ